MGTTPYYTQTYDNKWNSNHSITARYNLGL